MHHVAIMNPNMGFLEKLLDGKKNIESRWSIQKRSPFNNIKKGDEIYFKNSGKPVIVKSDIKEAIFFENLNPKKVKELINIYGKDIGIEDDKKFDFYKSVKNKKFCTLIFLENITKVKPFNINKKGYGNMSSWLSIKNVKDIKITIDKN